MTTACRDGIIGVRLERCSPATRGEDPVDPITAAVVSAVAKLAEPAVKDAYEGLKALIVRKLGAQSQVASAIQDLEKEPTSEGRRLVLREKVAASGVDKDDEVTGAAKAVIAAAGTQSGTSVVQNVTGDQNIFSGTGDVSVNRS